MCPTKTPSAFLKALALFIFASTSPFAHGRLVLKNSENLFYFQKLDTYAKSANVIHQENLSTIKSFIQFNNKNLNMDRGKDYGKPEYLHFEDATSTLIAMDRNPVVSTSKNYIYDPNNMGIGFCFGRAMFAHLDLVYKGLNRNSIMKAFVVGEMGNWGWHVTTIAQSKNAEGFETWLAIDPVAGKVIPLKQWYELMMNQYSTDKKLKLYITLPTRFGPDTEYNEQMLRSSFFNNYFNDLIAWFEKESKLGKYPVNLRKLF